MAFRHRTIIVALVVSGSLSLGAVAAAADDAAAFVDALRQQKMYDLALDFLDRAKQDRLVGDEFKKRILLERGLTFQAMRRGATSSSENKRFAEQARAELEKFSASSKNGALAAEAKKQVASMLIETAKNDLNQLKLRPGSSSKAEATRKSARKNFEEARELLTKVDELLVEVKEKLPKTTDPKKQAKEKEERLRLLKEMATIRIVRAYLLHQQATTYDKDDKEAIDLNKKAAAELLVLQDKYSVRGFSGGLQALFYQGECFLDLKEYKKAIACFEMVAAQVGGQQPLKTLSLTLQAKCYLLQEQYEAVLAKQGVWLEDRQNKASTLPGVLAVKYQVAEAMRLKSALPKTEEDEKRKLLAGAKEFYKQVAEERNEYQKQAREVLAEAFSSEEEEERPAPETFAEALQAAKEAIGTMQAAEQAIPAAEENNPDAVPALKEKALAGQKDAMAFLLLAQQLVDEDTPLAQLNETRWYLSWLLWRDEQVHRSAVMSSFLARRYPGDTYSPKAAQLALVSYQKLYKQARAGAGDAATSKAGLAEAGKLKDLASFITRRWAGTALSEAAFGVLLNFSVEEKKFGAALKLVDQLEASRQAVFRARIANAMWQTQLRMGTEQETADGRETLKRKAIQLMQENFAALKNDGAARDTLALTSLYLAKAYLGDGKPAKAIELIEDPKAGPIALSKTNSKVASSPGYAVEAYKLALGAYVSVVPPQTDKALETMKDLEAVVLKTSGGAGQLTRVYLNLGIQLKKQIKTLQEQGNTEEAKRVSEAFVTFLDKINEQGSSDPIVRKWIAGTYYELAEGLEGNRSADEMRKEYYAKARAAFKTLLDDAAAATSGDPKKILGLKLQYGQTLRRSGEYKEALKLFESILVEEEYMFSVQIAAAYTLQEWGDAKDANKFDEAVKGTGQLNEKGKKVIWGWSHMGKVASSIARSKPKLKEKYQLLFYECWLNISRIRYMKAMKANGAKKKEQLKSARVVVKSMVDGHFRFLDTPFRKKFDDLVKDIQRAEGVANPIGLKEYVKEKP